MLIYASIHTPRLKYIADFISWLLFNEPAKIITDINDFQSGEGVKINYSEEKIDASFQIIPHTLLFEKDIQPQKITCFDHEQEKAFFKTGGDLPFDIFAASFYLITRYEEWLPHHKDMYGRFDHQQSLAFRENFLDRPLVNIWIKGFGKKLSQKFQDISFQQNAFTFLPTYDIDMAWSYKHKGWKRTIGSISRSIIRFQITDLKHRWLVALNKKPDPFYSFQWLQEIHQQHLLKPFYFILSAKKTGAYDKNISPRKKVMRRLMGEIGAHYRVGIHPSWQSGNDEKLLHNEIITLANIINRPVLISRQHFLRFSFPDTFRKLLKEGIKADYSMGYGTINGFRASVSTPFYWYDLEKDESTTLLLYPFCFMESTAHYDMKQKPEEGLIALKNYYEQVKAVDGTFIMIWHNHFLGSDPQFKGWKEIYESFITHVISENNQQ